jgi:TMEM175 potassium channel family protein
MRRKHGAILHHIGLFEMRRLEALSNTIFGVAMTLLAYDLPKASGFAKAPSWLDLAHAYAQPVIALMISFIVAGLFWFSHHRRLTVAPEGTRSEVFLNLLFLASIIILPVTNGLYGSYRLDRVVAVIYGAHLIVIGALNSLLWLLALRGRENAELLTTAMFPLGVFVVATATAFVAPAVAQFIWCLAFAAPLAGRLAARGTRRKKS